MNISDIGYIIKVVKHGESSAIVTLVTKDYGKLIGYAKGAISKKNLSLYQIGNLVQVEAYARLEENMLSFRIELISPMALNFLSSPQKLAALCSICSLLNDCLPEKSPIDRLYYLIDSFFNLIDFDNWLAHYCFFEFYLLEYLGIGLDLSECGDTQTTVDLEFVSPKSGRAICLSSGLPYRAKLFKYPHFIQDNNFYPTLLESRECLEMTGFFLNKNFFQTHGLKFPKNRDNLLKNLEL